MANRHQYWRLLVSPFLGAGVLHVWTNITTLTTFAVFLANDLPLWQIGESSSGCAEEGALRPARCAYILSEWCCSDDG